MLRINVVPKPEEKFSLKGTIIAYSVIIVAVIITVISTHL